MLTRHAMLMGTKIQDRQFGMNNSHHGKPNNLTDFFREMSRSLVYIEVALRSEVFFALLNVSFYIPLQKRTAVVLKCM